MAGATTVARSYAEALFALGAKTGEQQAYARAFDVLADVLETDRLVRDFLSSPKIDVAAKKTVLRRALAGRVAPLFINFLLVVLDKRRQRVLRAIAREYRGLLDEHLGRVHVQVTLAHEPDERMEEEITAELARILGRKVIPHIRVDGEILGGIVLRYGDNVMDGSVRRRLMSLRHQLLEAPLPETVAR